MMNHKLCLIMKGTVRTYFGPLSLAASSVRYLRIGGLKFMPQSPWCGTISIFPLAFHVGVSIQMAWHIWWFGCYQRKAAHWLWKQRRLERTRHYQISDDSPSLCHFWRVLVPIESFGNKIWNWLKFSVIQQGNWQRTRWYKQMPKRSPDRNGPIGSSSLAHAFRWKTATRFWRHISITTHRFLHGNRWSTRFTLAFVLFICRAHENFNLNGSRLIFGRFANVGCYRPKALLLVLLITVLH